MMKLSILLATLFGLSCIRAYDITISENYLDSSGNTNINTNGGTITIEDGYFYAFDSGTTHIFTSTVTNYGLFYVSDKLSSSMTFEIIGNVNNYGDLIANNINGTSLTYFAWNSNTLTNTGNIWFLGSSIFSGSYYYIWHLSIINEGTMNFIQPLTGGYLGYLQLGQLSTEFTNSGTIYLYHQAFQQTSIIDGTGCFDVGELSTFIPNYYGVKTIADSQIIYLSSSTSSLNIPGFYHPTFSYTVVGWGNGNVIEFDSTIASFSYSGDTLSITTSGSYAYTFTFIIGTGYDDTQMSIGTGLVSGGQNKALLYALAPPDSTRPSICAAPPPVPDPPIPNAQTTTTTTWSGSYTTTVTDGNTYGGIDTVVIELASNSQTTTTTTWTGHEASTTTETDTQGGTDTVVIELPPNSQTTTTTTWTGHETSTTTETDTQGGTDTVVIELPPNSQTTTTTAWSGNRTSTITETDTQGGTDTVVIEIPSNSQTTETSTWTGDITITETLTATQGGTDTVIIEVPSNSRTTLTSTWTGDESTTVTFTASQGGTDTIVVEIPSQSQSTSSLTSGSSSTISATTAVSSISSLSSSVVYYSNSSIVTLENQSSTYTLSSTASGSNPSGTFADLSSYSRTESNPSGTFVELSSYSETESTVIETKTDASTTVITITSCKDSKCTSIPVTTGITVVTFTTNDEVTEYTTYCPLSYETTFSEVEVANPTTTLTETNSVYHSTSASSLVNSSDFELYAETGATQSAIASQVTASSYETGNGISTTFSSIESGSSSTNDEGLPTNPISSSTSSLQSIASVSEAKATLSLNAPIIAIFMAYFVHLFTF